MTICTFDRRRLMALRRLAEKARQGQVPPPAGWSKSAIDPMGVVHGEVDKEGILIAGHRRASGDANHDSQGHHHACHRHL